jgi:hypothetical protein
MPQIALTGATATMVVADPIQATVLECGDQWRHLRAVDGGDDGRGWVSEAAAPLRTGKCVLHAAVIAHAAAVLSATTADIIDGIQPAQCEEKRQSFHV